MITIAEAREAARQHAAVAKQPGISVAACAVCSQNAGHMVRVLGPLVPFCREHLPPTTKDDYGTLLLDEGSQ
jgi:hypothetical protein